MVSADLIFNLLTYPAGVCSLLMNVAPIAAIVKLEKSGTVGGGTITFYGAQMYNCVTWASYGAFSWSLPLLVPNTLGNCVSTYSMLVFLTLARREEKAGKTLPATTYTKSLITVIFFLALSWGHLLLCLLFLLSGHEQTARSMTGWEGSIACVVMISAPLGVFKDIVRTKNAASLQPLMVTFAFMNTLLWTIAGFVRLDPFLIVPNVLCFAACVAQVVLLLMYGRKPPEAEAMSEAIAAVPFD